MLHYLFPNSFRKSSRQIHFQQIHFRQIRSDIFFKLLKKHEYFGQYGKILKVVVNKTNLYNVDAPDGPSVSAYITYIKKDDALKSILAVNGAWLDNKQLR